MGLRCLLGHDFDEPEVEREREEEGNEMVVTIREVKTCRQCGERQIISENKEVTAIRSAAEVGLDDADDADEAEPDSEAETTPTHPAVDEDGADDGAFEPPADADEDDGVILDEEPPGREPGEWPDSGGERATADADADADADAGEAGGLGADEVATEDEISRAGERADLDVDADPAPVEDDAEFIDAEEDATGGDESADADASADDGTVAWPDHEGVDDPAAGANGEGDAAAWPEHSGEDEGFDARPTGEAGEGDDPDVTFESGITPEAANGESAESGRARGGAGTESAGAGYDAEFVGGPDTDSDAGEEFVRAESRSVELETEMAGEPTEYYCPNCGYTRSGSGSSMRAGDICPECRKGYIAEREA